MRLHANAKTTPKTRLLFDAMPEGEACVFDLAALRPVLSRTATKQAHPELHDLAFRVDALLLLPELTASEPLIPLPREG